MRISDWSSDVCSSALLAKIRRVLGRLNPEAPHDVVLVLDATNGQNALSQIEIFKEVAGVSGLIMTKLDGTARGGVLVAAAEQYGLPIHAIGVGRSEEHTSELQSLMRNSYAVFCLKKKTYRVTHISVTPIKYSSNIIPLQ